MSMSEHHSRMMVEKSSACLACLNCLWLSWQQNACLYCCVSGRALCASLAAVTQLQMHIALNATKDDKQYRDYTCTTAAVKQPC